MTAEGSGPDTVTVTVRTLTQAEREESQRTGNHVQLW